MIRDAVEQKYAQRLKAISTAVHDLELELLESFGSLNQSTKGMKRLPASRLGRVFLVKCDQLFHGYSVFLMASGVSLAWTAARIRFRLKGGKPVRLDFQETAARRFP